MKQLVIESKKQYTEVKRKTFGKDGLVAEMRMNIQAMAVWGLKQYRDHKNLTVLNEVAQNIYSKEVGNITDLRNWVKKHANVKWSKGQTRGGVDVWKFEAQGKKAKVADKFVGKWYDKAPTPEQLRKKADKLTGKDDVQAQKLRNEASKAESKATLAKQYKVKSRHGQMVNTLKSKIASGEVDNLAMAHALLRHLEAAEAELLKIEAEGITEEKTGTNG